MRFLAVLLIIACCLAFCGFVFDYNLNVYIGKDIPWYCDCLAGLLTSPVNVTAAVIALVLIECDVPQPICFPDETNCEK